ncbi:MAG: hypothetical protein M5R41_16680 [Bacteroidia bacterium]|nr:hypothetical protein [Bacteroidia bacterium]
MNNLLSSAENFNTKAYPLPLMSAHPFLRSSVVPAICPKCKAPALHRSHAMSSADQFRKNFTSKKRFRCHVCSWEGWLDETRLTYPSVSLVGSVPTMNGEEVDIPSILLQDERNRPDADFPLQVPGARSRNTQSRETAPQPPSRDQGVSDQPGDEEGTPERKNGAGRASNGHTAMGSDSSTVLPRAELPDAEARPYSTTVTPGFHHRSRHKAFGCPNCNEFNLYRSRSRNLGEFLRKKFTNKRPYRCHTCGWRGWVIKGL